MTVKLNIYIGVYVKEEYKSLQLEISKRRELESFRSPAHSSLHNCNITIKQEMILIVSDKRK